ncbi:MAG: prepilin-type N-terminal cleavage/methylation domain-containing protein [bacterium]
MKRLMMRNHGFTLMELLVVLLIIGVLSTVALRTIDATRDRSLFDQTAREMHEIVRAVTGNPDLVYDGRRTDFGFYGDLGRMPAELRELVTNVTADPRWNGPYLRRNFVGDSLGYLRDGWGSLYSWNEATGTIASLGNGKYPLTMRVADSLPQLSDNAISGSITDVENNPPGDLAPGISVALYTNASPMPLQVDSVDAGGYYEFSARRGTPVPIGTHRLVVKLPAPTFDSISRYVTVTPRSRAIVDVRFARNFRSRLKMVGLPDIQTPDSNGFEIRVVNLGSVDDSITSVTFGSIAPPDSMYMTSLLVNGTYCLGFPIGVGGIALGQGRTAAVQPVAVVPPNLSAEVRFGFFDFVTDSIVDSLSPPARVRGREFRLRFSDGSEITVTP